MRQLTARPRPTSARTATRHLVILLTSTLTSPLTVISGPFIPPASFRGKRKGNTKGKEERTEGKEIKKARGRVKSEKDGEEGKGKMKGDRKGRKERRNDREKMKGGKALGPQKKEEQNVNL